MRKEFNVIDSPLCGRKLIEASAGTGKTYSLIHIVLRLIVEERIPIERLLLVTFTKAATAELKMRVRELLIRAQQAYEDCRNDDTRYDPTLIALIKKWRQAKIDPSVFQEAIDRLDDASICTIHSFCQKMLEEHKFSSSEGFDFEIGDDSDLRREVIEEFLREALTVSDDDEFKKLLLDTEPWDRILIALNSAPKNATVKLFDDLLFIDPKTGQHAKKEWKKTDNQINLEKSLRSLLTQFIEIAPETLKRKKRENGIRSFDDLLLDMYEELDNRAFVERVQSRYDGILIDEFQDTDPIQYTIFKRLFLAEDSCAKSVFFVGDPKQSIYRFRNADINTYLAAQADIGEICELKKNYRSSPTLVEGINRFFTESGAPFLDAGMGYSAIAAGSNKGPLLLKKGDSFEALPTFAIWTKEKAALNPTGDRNQQITLIANEIAALLSGNVYKSENERLKPSDIAVLFRVKKYVPDFRAALAKKGIRVLFQDENSIFATEEAREMLLIIEALESPQDIKALRLARSTRLMGESINAIIPEAFAHKGQSELDDKAALKARELIEEAITIWNKRGVSAAIAKIMLECGTQKRLLPLQDGERQLANYQHLMEVLQEASLSLKGISGLARWLKQQIQNPPDDEKYQLRLDSDADLVNVMTIHKSKGLEYPVIFLPFANALELGSPGHHKTRVFKSIHNGRISFTFSFYPVYPNIDETLYHEEDLENLRLAYVAMTRASQRLVLPLTYYKSGKAFKITNNAYAKALTGKEKASQSDFETRLNHWLKDAPKGLALRKIADDTQCLQWYEQSAVREDKNEASEELSAACGRVIPTSWFPTSYTAIARGATETTERLTLIEEKEDSDDNELMNRESHEKNDQPKDPQTLTIMDFERGLESGTFLHALFERIGFDIVKKAAEGSAEAEATLNRHLTRLMIPFQYHLQPYGIDGYLPVLNKLLKDVLCSKLVDKGVFGTQTDLRLCDLDAQQKTAEMNFTIAIGSPAEGHRPVSAKNLSKLLKHFDPLYHIEIDNDRELRGYLTGAIDLAFEFDGQFFVLDWKGSKLADTAKGFSNERMLEEIRKHHYSLQYLIYLVALRRHLRFCGIENPEEKMGGVIYAFIRAIRRDDPNPYGVFTARPPKALIACLDEFFENGYHEGSVNAYAQTSQLEGMI